MNTFDVILLGFACVLVLVGMIKGLVRILIGVGALVAAFAVAAKFHSPLATRLDGLAIPPEALSLLSYVAIFLGVMIAGGLAAFVLRKLLKAAMLSWADRIGGAALGLVAAMLTAALLILPMVAYSPWSEKVLGQSMLAPYVTVVADIANTVAPEELSSAYESGVDRLRQYWQDHWPGGSI